MKDLSSISNAIISLIIGVLGGCACFAIWLVVNGFLRLGMDPLALIGYPLFFIGAIASFIICFRKLEHPK